MNYEVTLPNGHTYTLEDRGAFVIAWKGTVIMAEYYREDGTIARYTPRTAHDGELTDLKALYIKLLDGERK